MVYGALGLVTPASAVIVWWVAHRTLLAMDDAAPRRARLRLSLAILVVLLAFLGVSYTLGATGVFRGASYLVPVFSLLPPYLGIKIVENVPLLLRLTARLPNAWIIGVQVYRLLGVVFLAYMVQGLMPAAFALPSGIGDILIGTTAPLVAFAATRNGPGGRTLVRLWNYVGIGDLVVAVTMGALTAPTLVQALSFEAPNELIISYPLVLVPTFAVLFALFLHVLSLRILKTQVR